MTLHEAVRWPPSHTPAADVIAALGLEPLPVEGGHWRPQGRSEALSSILFLLTSDPAGFSALHRLSCTEGWQWLAGAAAELTLLDDHGVRRHRLTAQRTLVVPATTWQGATTLGAWTLVSCWCAPGYTDEACTFAERDELTGAFPEAADTIAALTR
ncbi:MAG: cupin domain-containing protein [Actinomycetales bacterium]